MTSGTGFLSEVMENFLGVDSSDGSVTVHILTTTELYTLNGRIV